MSYPKNTAICIEHLYPNAIPLDDFTVLSILFFKLMEYFMNH